MRLEIWGLLCLAAQLNSERLVAPPVPPPPQPCRNRITTVVRCEGMSMQISCSRGEVIDILYASYGRRSKDICPKGNIQNTQCSAAKSYDIVYEKCNRKPTCVLSATNSVFGDPCRGISKYLAVQYRCCSLRSLPVPHPRRLFCTPIRRSIRPRFGQCVARFPLTVQTGCRGSCPSWSDYPLGCGDLAVSCLCCQPQRILYVPRVILCTNGARYTVTLNHVISCSCGRQGQRPIVIKPKPIPLPIPKPLPNPEPMPNAEPFPKTTEA